MSANGLVIMSALVLALRLSWLRETTCKTVKTAEKCLCNCFKGNIRPAFAKLDSADALFITPALKQHSQEQINVKNVITNPSRPYRKFFHCFLMISIIPVFCFHHFVLVCCKWIYLVFLLLSFMISFTPFTRIYLPPSQVLFYLLINLDILVFRQFILAFYVLLQARVFSPLSLVARPFKTLTTPLGAVLISPWKQHITEPVIDRAEFYVWKNYKWHLLQFWHFYKYYMLKVPVRMPSYSAEPVSQPSVESNFSQVGLILCSKHYKGHLFIFFTDLQ